MAVRERASERLHSAPPSLPMSSSAGWVVSGAYSFTLGQVLATAVGTVQTYLWLSDGESSVSISALQGQSVIAPLLGCDAPIPTLRTVYRPRPCPYHPPGGYWCGLIRPSRGGAQSLTGSGSGSALTDDDSGHSSSRVHSPNDLLLFATDGLLAGARYQHSYNNHHMFCMGSVWFMSSASASAHGCG